MGVVVAFGMLELAARVYLNRIAGPETFKHYASLRQLKARGVWGDQTLLKYVPHRYLGYAPTPNHRYRKNRHNSLGFRGEEINLPKPESQFRIVCLGGSTTYTGKMNDYRRSYPDLLQEGLRDHGYEVRVVNAGVESWTTYESLAGFAFRVLDLDPDMVIVYHGINDCLARFVWPPEAYWGDNSGSRAAVLTERFMAPFWEYSTLIRAVLIRTGHGQSHSSVADVYDLFAPTFLAFEWRDQVLDGTYPAGVFEHVSAREMLEANKPVYFRRNIECLVALAKQHGVVPVLATFAYSTEFREEPWVTSQEVVWAYDEMNGVVKAVAQETGAVLFDFGAAFPMDRTYYADCFHVNEPGAVLKRPRQNKVANLGLCVL